MLKGDIRKLVAYIHFLGKEKKKFAALCCTLEILSPNQSQKIRSLTNVCNMSLN